jgi:hypothetical protein
MQLRDMDIDSPIDASIRYLVGYMGSGCVSKTT